MKNERMSKRMRRNGQTKSKGKIRKKKEKKEKKERKRRKRRRGYSFFPFCGTVKNKKS